MDRKWKSYRGAHVRVMELAIKSDASATAGNWVASVPATAAESPCRSPEQPRSQLRGHRSRKVGRSHSAARTAILAAMRDDGFELPPLANLGAASPALRHSAGRSCGLPATWDAERIVSTLGDHPVDLRRVRRRAADGGGLAWRDALGPCRATAARAGLRRRRVAGWPPWRAVPGRDAGATQALSCAACPATHRPPCRWRALAAPSHMRRRYVARWRLPVGPPPAGRRGYPSAVV